MLEGRFRVTEKENMIFKLTPPLINLTYDVKGRLYRSQMSFPLIRKYFNREYEEHHYFKTK